MQRIVEEVLSQWHKHFLDEEKQYSEFESSDIEYFVGCMLYNHFAFSKALENLKTMDLSYDFLSSMSDEEYKDAEQKIKSITLENESNKLVLLQKFIQESRAKYTKSELYLLDRLHYHVDAMAQRYERDVEVEHINFQNPLLRK